VRAGDAELIVEILYTVVATGQPGAIAVTHPLGATA
jgi:hypothetical protein